MPQSLITFIKGDSVGSETDYRDALPVNMYAVEREMFGAKGYMMQAPGLVELSECDGVSRGAVWNDVFDTQFRVLGGKFCSVDAAGVVTEIGDVPGTGYAAMPYSFNTQAVVADGRYFLYDPANGFREVTDTDLGTPIDAVWVDGYYFFTDGEFIYHTDISDESSIDPLKFATAEFIPDYTYGALKTQDNKVMVFGRYSVEYFTNDASDNFAFSRLESRAMKVGIVSTFCKTETDKGVYALGGHRGEGVRAYLITVGSAQPVSTREVDKVLEGYSEDALQGAYVEDFTLSGTHFVAFHLPSETLVFNETIASSVGLNNSWSIFKTDVAGDAPWRAIHEVYDNRSGDHVVGDRFAPKVGYLDESVSTHYNELVEWLLFTPFMYLETASIDKMEIETIPGFTGYEDATVFISLTYNGVTHTREWTEMYGEPMEYGKRFVVRRMGYVPDWLGVKLRGVSRSRMAFGRGFIEYG